MHREHVQRIIKLATALHNVDGEIAQKATCEPETNAARRAEPQSLPWYERCAVLAFTTYPRAWDWARGFTCPVDDAAKADDAIRAFAEKAIGDAVGSEAKVNAVIRHLRDTTHLVNSAKTWRSRRCRPATEVFRTSYGSPLEIAALAAAALRSVGFEVSTGVAIGDRVTIFAFAVLPEADAPGFEPRIIQLDKSNAVVRRSFAK